jgi:hypothetical protein
MFARKVSSISVEAVVNADVLIISNVDIKYLVEVLK